MNRVRSRTGIVLLSRAMPLLGVSVLDDRSTGDWLRLCISGALGIGIADTVVFMALRRLGPGLLAIVECTYAPTVVLLAVLFLHEQLNVAFLIGAVLVICGVAWVSTEQVSRPPDFRAGMVLGVLGIVSMAVGITLAKPALENGHLVELSLIRLLAGVGFQVVWIAIDPRQRVALKVLRPQAAWKTLLPASFLGSYVSMMLWLGGFKWGDVSSAAVLNQMSTIFTILLAWMILGEPITRRRLVGAGLAFSGAVLILAMR